MSEPQPSSAQELVSASIKFLQAPSERPLKEKIEFLVKTKNLEKHQLVFALQKAALYDASKLDPIITELFPVSSDSQLSQSFPTATYGQPPFPPLSHPRPLPQSGFSWMTGLATGGLALATAIGSFVASRKSAAAMVAAERTETVRKLEEIRREMREQLELDREKQHSDLMSVVSLLQTQADAVQENLELLRQSIALVESQMKLQTSQQSAILSERMSLMHAPAGMRSSSGGIIRGSADDALSQHSAASDHRVDGRRDLLRDRRKGRSKIAAMSSGFSSADAGGGVGLGFDHSSESESGARKRQRQRSKLGAIAGLLDAHVGDEEVAYDWIKQDLSKNDNGTVDDSDKDKTAVAIVGDGVEDTIDTDGDLMAEATGNGVLRASTFSEPTDGGSEAEIDLSQVPCIYNLRWKELVTVSFADMKSASYCTAAMIRLLSDWQLLVYQNAISLSASKKSSKRSKRRRRKLPSGTMPNGPMPRGSGGISDDFGDEASALLTVAKLKSCLSTIAFYIRKIANVPYNSGLRKINCCNKQYNERLKSIPQIEELLTAIGYEKSMDGLFWILDAPKHSPKTKAQFETVMKSGDLSSANEEVDKTAAIPFLSQLSFLKKLNAVLKNLFVDTLPAEITRKLDSAIIASPKKEEEFSATAKVPMETDATTVTTTETVAATTSTDVVDTKTADALDDGSSVIKSAEVASATASSHLAAVQKSDATLAKEFTVPTAEGKTEEMQEVDTSAGTALSVPVTEALVGKELSAETSTPHMISTNDGLVEASSASTAAPMDDNPYSENFMDIVKDMQAGITPTDVRTDIDDMPKDPTAALSQSTLTALPKPFTETESKAQTTDEWLKTLAASAPSGSYLHTLTDSSAVAMALAETGDDRHSAGDCESEEGQP